MKKIITLLLLLFSLQSFAAITMVTDLDDTVKITNSGQEIEATINGLFSTKVFTAMPEFLSSVRDYVDEVHLLSASPSLIRPSVLKTLKKNGIEVNSVILKNPLSRQTVLQYKVAELKKLFEASSDDFILVGDDVGHDPEAYEEIKSLYPNRVLAIYIHAIKGRSLPKSSFQYWTTFDLFLKEYVHGRMLAAPVKAAAEKLLKQVDMNYVFPHFAKCPRTPEMWLWQARTIFAREAFALAGKFTLYCLATNSTI